MDAPCRPLWGGTALFLFTQKGRCGMKREEISPDELPWDISFEIGEIKQAVRFCPGVFYVCLFAPYEDETEFYLVDKRTKAVSDTAKSYGHPLGEITSCLLYPCSTEINGRKILDYEIQRYFIKNHLPEADNRELRDAAAYGKETCPEYFGAFHPPVDTPFGHIVRYISLMNGVFWAETDTLEALIVVAYPCWLDVFTNYVLKFAARVGRDEEAKTDATFEYLCFPEKVFPLVLFELQRYYVDFQDTPYINKAALMNVIYRDFLDYAVTFNTIEQSGLNDLTGLFLNAIGQETELRGSVENMISLTQDAGFNFLRL